MLFRLLVCALLISFFFESKAQQTINYKIESQAIVTSGHVVPFWMRSNQYGSIPLEGLSAGFIGSARKVYHAKPAENWYGKEKLIDWGAGFEARANLGKTSELMLIEGYGKLRVAMFEIKAGRTKDIMGFNGDSTLSSGNFAVSGNALGIPKIEVSIPTYWPIPGLDGLLAIKGNFAHGWVGRTILPEYLQGGQGIRYPIYNNRPRTFLHQKSFYGSLGKENWKIKFFGGFNHQVYWGNERETQGNGFRLSPFETLFHVVIGAAYGNEYIPRSKIGNQIGSIDIAAAYKFKMFSLKVYRQNFYDVGALSRLANIKDGLYGISVTNENFDHSASQFQWNTLLFELFHSKHQAGEYGSKLTKSGDENYYNNYFYSEGWSYKEAGLGNPLISRKADIRSGHAIYPTNYFANNRVIAFHLGNSGAVGAWDYVLKATYSLNYGTFGTSLEGHSLGEITPVDPKYGIFGKINQFSFYLESYRSLNNGLKIGGTFALDRGKLLYNSVGGGFKISKSF